MAVDLSRGLTESRTDADPGDSERRVLAGGDHDSDLCIFIHLVHAKKLLLADIRVVLGDAVAVNPKVFVPQRSGDANGVFDDTLGLANSAMVFTAPLLRGRAPHIAEGNKLITPGQTINHAPINAVDESEVGDALAGIMMGIASLPMMGRAAIDPAPSSVEVDLVGLQRMNLERTQARPAVNSANEAER